MLALLAVTSLLALALPAQEPAPVEPVVPAQWRVIWTSVPQTQATIAWSTTAPGRAHRVRYDTESRGGAAEKYRFETEAQRNGRFSADAPVLHYHHARLSGLQPATTYWFVIDSDGALSRELHFVTAPAEDRPLRLLSGGDSRSERTQRRVMNTLVSRIAGEDDGVIALCHGGDYIHDGNDLGQWSEWLTDHELTVTEKGRILPIVPARGNHEATGPLYDEVFDTPGGEGRNYFALHVTPQILFVTLNSEIALGGPQAEFLEQTLANAAAAKVRWQLAQYHTPAWPAVKQPGRALQHFVPLFEKYDVDAVIECDGHVRKRTLAIRGGKPDGSGVVYFGEGGLGVKLRSPETSRWYLQEPGSAGSDYHVWELSFAGKELTLRAIGVDGATLDRATLRARERR
jgi:hypothetical protein